MTQFEIGVVVRKLNNIKKYLEQLRKSADIDLADYKENFEQQMIVERLLHLLIESAIDINMHLVVSDGQPPPETYYDSFLILAKIGAISTKLAEQLAPSAGLRNRLVHDYDDMNLDTVYGAIDFALRLYPQYLQQVERYAQQLNES